MEEEVEEVEEVEDEPQGCKIPRKWPAIGAAIRRLKHIGPMLEKRWEAENVTTLRDLVDLIRGHSKAQNMRIFKRVFANQKAGECVPRSESRNHLVETKQLNNPWPDPPNRIRNRRGLTPGHYSYCVGTYNKCGWMTVEAFLRQTNELTDQEKATRIPSLPDRTNYCRENDPAWCRSDEPGQQRRAPPRAAPPQPPPPPQHIVADIMDVAPVPDNGNARGRAETRKRYAQVFRRLHASWLQKIALVLWHNEAVNLSATEIKTFTGIKDKKLVYKLIGQNKNDRGMALFDAAEQKGSYQLKAAIKAEDEPTFFARIGIRLDADLPPHHVQERQGGGKNKRELPPPISSSTVVVKYYIDKNTKEYDSLKKHIQRTLGNTKVGIAAKYDVAYQRVANAKKADIIVKLVPQAEVNRECLFSNLSCSIITVDQSEPDEILFSLENWMGGSKFQGSLDDYRTYLVNHEFMHCRPFHRDHPSVACEAPGNPVSVMYQQSLGLPPQCTPNVWP